MLIFFHEVIDILCVTVCGVTREQEIHIATSKSMRFAAAGVALP